MTSVFAIPPPRPPVDDAVPLPPAPAPIPCSFEGAAIRLYGGEVLIVVVFPWVLRDPIERELHVLAFRTRFRRTIVLVARDRRGTPTYWGPAAIVRALSVLPFDALSWERYIYRRPAPPKLPMAHEPARSQGSGTSGARSWEANDGESGRPGDRSRLERDPEATTIRICRVEPVARDLAPCIPPETAR